MIVKRQNKDKERGGGIHPAVGGAVAGTFFADALIKSKGLKGRLRNDLIGAGIGAAVGGAYQYYRNKKKSKEK